MGRSHKSQFHCQSQTVINLLVFFLHDLIALQEKKNKNLQNGDWYMQLSHVPIGNSKCIYIIHTKRNENKHTNVKFEILIFNPRDECLLVNFQRVSPYFCKTFRSFRFRLIRSLVQIGPFFGFHFF